MERPVMNPGYVEEVFSAPQDPWRIRMWRILKPVLRVLKFAVRILIWNPLTRPKFGAFRNEDGNRWQRLMRGLMYRAAFLPVMIALVVAMLVWAGTHPQFAVAALDPNANDIYFETVKFEDSHKLKHEAWLVPLVNAKKVLEDGEDSIRKRYPAVVLVPDSGRGADQMLRLIPVLHEAGFVLLVLNSPNTSMLNSPGITFGLREVERVRAGVELLRKRPFVDARRIAVVGVGGGANAAILAARGDKSLETLVLDSPHTSTAAVLESRIAPTRSGLRWMQPLCKWGFELGYQVDAEELNFDQYQQLLEKRKVLKFDKTTPHLRGDARNEAIRDFLASSLNVKK